MWWVSIVVIYELYFDYIKYNYMSKITNLLYEIDRIEPINKLIKLIESYNPPDSVSGTMCEGSLAILRSIKKTPDTWNNTTSSSHVRMADFLVLLSSFDNLLFQYGDEIEKTGHNEWLSSLEGLYITLMSFYYNRRLKKIKSSPTDVGLDDTHLYDCINLVNTF